MRLAVGSVVAIALHAAGCLTYTDSRVGHPPPDTPGPVRHALDAAVLPAFEKHATGSNWVARPTERGTSGNTRETRWRLQFACRQPGPETGEVWRLPEGEYTRILVPVRADVLAALERAGVEVIEIVPLEVLGRTEIVIPNPFVIRYVRRNGDVAGEVTGSIGPDGSGPDTRYTNLEVTLREWTTR